LRKILIAAILSWVAAATALAQEASDLLGKWRFEVAEPDDRRCGASRTLGEMHVTKKITARAYRGSTRVRSVTERCGQVSESDSGFTLRVRDSRVSIEYDNESWTSDSLVFDGERLSGFDSAGTPMEFLRQAAVKSEPAPEELAALETFLQSLKPELSRQIRAEFGQDMLQNLRRTGLTREESVQVATQTVDRMADCVLELARAEILDKNLPIDDVVNGKNRTVLLQPENLDYREIECVYEAALNAGVVIR
jgi:hypothetical protein